MPRSHSKRSHTKKSHRRSHKSHVKGHYRSIGKTSARHRIRVKSHYRMRGMGPLLSMYGMVGQGLEEEYMADKAKLAQTKAAYEAEKDAIKREQLRQLMESARIKMDNAKEKMSAMLKGVKDAASKASEHLSTGAKVVGSKLSSGLKSLGSRFSSGLKSLSSGIQNKYNNYKDNKDKALYTSLHKKYGSDSSTNSY